MDLHSRYCCSAVISGSSFRMIGRLMLAHHPTCAAFGSDVFHVRGHAVCVGCAVHYPAAVLAIAIGIFFIPAWPALAAGATLCLAQGASFLGLTKRRSTKIVVRAVTGLAFGLIIFGLWSLLNWWQAAAVLMSFMTVGFLTQIPKISRMKATCESCIYKMDWDNCPGFGFISRPDDPHLDGTTQTSSQGTTREWKVLQSPSQEPRELQ